MTNYLLLRNNKESGPYTIDDLIRLGLKAYDLVWVQGKSAAWRYPSELEELKAYAPSVEEQPFDRFYKKNGEVKELRQEAPVVKEEPAKQKTSFISAEHEKYIPKKSVFVTMPGGQKIATTQPVKKEVAVAKEEPRPISAPVQQTQTITISENPNTAQVKYSQPLDDIKEMYVKTLYERKQKIARKNFWLQSLKKTAVIGGLIAIGVIAGLVFKSNGSKKELIAQKQETIQSQLQTVKQESPVTLQDQKQDQDKNQEQDNLNSASSAGENQTLPPPTGGFVNKKVQQPQTNPLELSKTIDKPVNGNAKKEVLSNSAENDFSDGLVAQGVDINPATGERSRKVRGANDKDRKAAEAKKNNDERLVVSGELGGLVAVSSNEYKKVAFGGIRDLQLTLTNDSKYLLDNVIVELQYIKPNELPLRTENVQFKSIAPGEAATVRIPDTNRGIKVTYKIIHIKSKQMDEGVAGNQ